MRTIDKSRSIRKELNVTRSNKNLVLKIFNELPIGVIIVSNSTNYWINSATINIFGYKKEEPLYKKIEEELLPLIFDKTDSEHKFTGEEDYKDFEISLKNKKEQTIYLNISPKHIQFNNQQSLLLLINDITYQKFGKKKYLELIDNLQAAVIVHNADTNIITSNKKANDILGLSIEQMKGEKPISPKWQFVRDDGKLMPLEEFPENIVRSSNKALNNYIIGVKRPDRDHIIWLLCNAFPNHDINNNLISIVVTFIDISKIKNKENELQQNSNEFEANTTAKSITNSNGSIIHANKAFLELWGYKNIEDVLGNSITDFFTNQKDVLSVLEVLGNTRKWEGEFLAKKNTIEIFNSKVRANAIKDKNEKTIGYSWLILNQPLD